MVLRTQDPSQANEAQADEGASQGKQPIVIESAEQYINQIVAHAGKSSNATSLYPGHNYQPLADFFERYRPTTTEEKHAFTTLYDLNLEQNNQLRVQHFSSVQEFEKACEVKKELSHDKQAPALLLFLRGYPSTAWLGSIGWKCDVDPEFFLRHIDFRSGDVRDENDHTLPALPSTSTNITRLRASTIGHRQNDGSPNQTLLERLRQTSAQEMKDYMKNLRRHNEVKTGHSIVRSFGVYDQNDFVIEQDISICVNGFGRGWIGIVWLDSGHPLAVGPEGPWSKSIKPAYSWGLRLNPIIQHRPKIALKTNYMVAGTDPDRETRKEPFLQSVCQVPVHYGRFLSTSTAVVDPFYALSEVFTLVASSESQYLNMVEQKIKSESAKVMGASKREEVEDTDEQSSILSNLVYYKTILDEHIQRLKTNILSIETQRDHKWPEPDFTRNTSTGMLQQKKASKSARTLFKDFEYLLERAKTLSESCDRGIDIAGNNAMITESRRAIQHAKRTVKLTILAFCFIPASFTTSLFGMNFKQLGQDKSLDIWVWFIVLIPTYAISLVLLYKDVDEIQKQFRDCLHGLIQGWSTKVP
ncbi:MAG: hypothetical protein Q9207_006361 [Kuettlingeria erythrocarpa]